jgi:hypothetical protein
MNQIGDGKDILINIWKWNREKGHERKVGRIIPEHGECLERNIWNFILSPTKRKEERRTTSEWNLRDKRQSERCII